MIEDVNVFTSDVARECLLTRARKISRIVTSLYDEALRPHGIHSPQLSLLVLIARLGGATRAELGRANSQDRSTLSRNLTLLLNAGWVQEEEAGGRNRPVHITDAGLALLSQAAPSWRAAQKEARRLFGSDGSATFLKIADGLEADLPA
jgi:DNA-binding MarR family transcriptional regulator